jgi:type IV pilus assembly protein PilN
MIRINLLAAERTAKKKPAALQSAQKMVIGCSLILVAAVAFIAWRFTTLSRQSAALNAQIAAAQQETTRLRSIIQQVQQYEQRKAQLQQRVTLIEQLRRGQSTPVHLLDEVSRALPDRLWLITMLQRGNDFTIEGRTTTLTGLSDFVSNLEASPWFKKPVEIVDSAVDQGPNGDLVRFSIRATMQNPEAPPPAAPAGRGAPPAK